MGSTMQRAIYASLTVFAAFSLAACSADTVNYPSLARRPAERWSENPPAPAPNGAQTPAPLDAKTIDRIDSLVGQARSADASFRQHVERTRALVAAASGAPMGSEAWSVATVALSDLESARSQAMVALADLDELMAAHTVMGGNVAPILAARDSVIAMVAEEDAVLAGLKDKMAP